MSNTPTVTDIKKALKSGYYGLVNLALATLAYTDSKDSGDIKKDFTDAIKSLKALPAPSGTTMPTDGSWKLDWGPAVNPINSNLCYVATFGVPDTSATSGRRNLLRVVGLRGTDISTHDEGVLRQIIQDLDAFHQTNWFDELLELDLLYKKKANPFGRDIKDGEFIAVAQGSANALTTIVKDCVVDIDSNDEYSKKSQKQCLAEYLFTLKDDDLDSVPMVVTGHSLGGALTQIVSFYLAWQVGGAFTKDEKPMDNIFPAAFAPPTVGGPDFAKRYDKLFPDNYFYHNAGDLVPQAFANINNIPALWGDYHHPTPARVTQAPCPLELIAAIALYEKKLPTYQRPSNNTLEVVADYLPGDDTMKEFLEDSGMESLEHHPWGAQLVWQHFPPCYYIYMKQQLEGMAEYPSFAKIPSGYPG